MIDTEVLEKTTCKCLFASIHLEKLPFEAIDADSKLVKVLRLSNCEHQPSMNCLHPYPQQGSGRIMEEEGQKPWKSWGCVGEAIKLTWLLNS